MIAEYKCSYCDGVFEKKWSDEEASAEFYAHFPGHDIRTAAVVCDDCYQKHFVQLVHPENS